MITLQVFNLPSAFHVKILRFLNYETVDRLASSSARFAELVDAHIEQMALRQINSVAVYGYGYFDGAVATGTSTAGPQSVSPTGETPQADVVITEYREQPVSNNQKKYRKVFRGECSSVMSAVSKVLRHAKIRVLSFHGFKLDLQWAQEFANLPAVSDKTVELTIRESELEAGALRRLIEETTGFRVCVLV